MTSTLHIDLDSVSPAYEPHTPRQLVISGRRRVGVSPRNLLDWRRLGRRAVQLDDVATAAHSAFWAEMERLAPAASRRRAAWFSQPDDMLIKFTGEWYSTDVASSALDRLTRGIEDDFFLVPLEVGGHLMRMQDRAVRLRSYHLTYQQAFRRAVEDRLLAPLMQESTSSTWFRPRLVLVRLDEHTYPISIDKHAKPTWLSDYVVEAS